MFSNFCALMARFSRPRLLYDYDSLEPHIDAETMTVHHKKHHEAYVAGVNKLSDSVPENVPLHQLLSGLMSNEGLKEDDKRILMTSGGGHYNHSLFWQYMSPNSCINDMSEFLKGRIKNDFGSFDEFKDEFDRVAATVFGSGWAWWVFDYGENRSYIVGTKDQINPIMNNGNLVCLLGLDVWEHAYYLKFKNERKEYIKCFWNVVNWGLVSEIHDKIVLSSEPRQPLEITDDGYIKFV